MKRAFLGLALIGILAVLGLAALWKAGLNPADLPRHWQGFQIWMRNNPWAMFLALCVLPGLPVPMMVLLPLAGLSWQAGTHPVTAGMMMLAAMAFNLSWTYWLAARPARFLVEKFLERTRLRLPDLPRGEHVRLILILRLTPGIPFFIQNYILGFLRAPFGLYLPVSLVLSGLIAFGIMVFPDAMRGGNTKMIITSASVLVVGILVTTMLRARFAARKNQDSPTRPDPANDI